MNAVYIIGHVHHLLNKPKKWTFAYNSDSRVYLLSAMFSHGQHMLQFRELLLEMD